MPKPTLEEFLREYESENSKKYLSFRKLQEKLGGRGRSTIYRDVENGRLPKPIKLGSRLYWIEADIDAVISELTK